MPIKSSGYFNDPAMAQVAANIAGLFEPPSGADAAGFATAAKTRQQTKALAEYYRLIQSGVPPREAEGLAIGADLYDPSASFNAVDINAATQRRGQDVDLQGTKYTADVGATTTRRGQDITAASQLKSDLLAPVAEGATRFVPPTIADQFAVPETQRGNISAAPGEQITLPGTGVEGAPDQVIAGATVPLTLEQEKAIAFNELTAQQQQDILMGADELVQGVDPVSKKPIWVTRGEAARRQLAPYKVPTMDEVNAAAMQQATAEDPETQRALVDSILHGGETPLKVVPAGATQPIYQYPGKAIGQTAYVEPTSVEKVVNGQALMQDDSAVPVYQEPGESVWRNAQTKLPIDMSKVKAVSNLPTPQGGIEDILTKPVQSNLEQQIIDATQAQETAVALRDLVAKSPSSQGIVGMIRGTLQNWREVAGEAGDYFGGDIDAIRQRIDSGLEGSDLAQSFDPNIPAIDALANLLAYQYAKTQTGERLSNEAIQNYRRSLGIDSFSANQKDSMARLNTAIATIERARNTFMQARKGGVESIVKAAPEAPAATSIPPAAAAPAAAAPAATDTEEVWDIDPATGKPRRVK